MVAMLEQDRQQFPALAGWLHDELPRVPEDARVWDSFLRVSEMHALEARFALRWADGVRPATPLVCVSALNRPDSLLRVYARFDTATPDRVFIDVDLARRFEAAAAEPEPGGARRFLQATVLHELCHWADARDGVFRDASAGVDLGERFERLAYGDKVRAWWQADAGDVADAGQGAGVGADAAASRGDAAVIDSPFVVPVGQLTFDAEGMEQRGPFFSRVPHVPGSTSGVTIGRGYDLKERSAEEVRLDLAEAGVDAALAERIAGGVGLAGDEASAFVRRHLAGVEVTPAQQKALFLKAWRFMEADVRRICGKPDVLRTYGATDWEALHPAMRDVTVDLRFRGDYHGKSRKRVQPTLVAGDLGAFAAVIRDRDLWAPVPRDRFERRVRYVEDALRG